MSKLLIAFLSFLLGGGIGIILMSCLVISKESDIDAEKLKNNKR